MSSPLHRLFLAALLIVVSFGIGRAWEGDPGELTLAGNPSQGAFSARADKHNWATTDLPGPALLKSEQPSKKPDEGASSKEDVKRGRAANPEVKEIAQLKNRIIELQNKGKLGFRKLVACSSVESFGVYSPLKQGDRITSLVLYMEPANYGTLVTKDRYIIDCAVDVAIFNESGKVVAGKKGVLKIKRVTRSPVLDLFYKIRINLKKPLKHGMTIKTLLRDKIKNDSAGVTYRINLKRTTKPAPREV